MKKVQPKEVFKNEKRKEGDYEKRLESYQGNFIKY